MSTLRKPKKVEIPKMLPRSINRARTTKALLKRLKEEQAKRKKKK